MIWQYETDPLTEDVGKQQKPKWQVPDLVDG